MPTRLNPHVESVLKVEPTSIRPSFVVAALLPSAQMEAEKLEDYGHMFLTRPRTRIVYVLIPHAPLLVSREFLDDGGFSRYVHVSSCKIESGDSVAKKTFAVRNTNGVTLSDLVSGIRREMKHPAWPFVVLLDRKVMKKASDALGLIADPHDNTR